MVGQFYIIESASGNSKKRKVDKERRVGSGREQLDSPSSSGEDDDFGTVINHLLSASLPMYFISCMSLINSFGSFGEMEGRCSQKRCC